MLKDGAVGKHVLGVSYNIEGGHVTDARYEHVNFAVRTALVLVSSREKMA